MFNKSLTLQEEIIANFTDGVLLFDEEDKLSLINPQAEAILRVEKEEVLAKNVLKLGRFGEFGPLVELLGAEIKRLFRKELKIHENLILEVTSVHLMKERRKRGSLVILHNVTREKLVERMKTEFVSLAAHQLRTPLSAIKWSLRMILDGDVGEITEEQRKMLERSYKSNERTINLINDLLNVTRIEEGRYLFERILIDIEDVLSVVINSYKEVIRKRKIKFKFIKPKKKLPQVMVDLEKIKLAIGNLLDNALRYTPPGGRVRISLSGDQKRIEVSIKDTGIGIPKNQQGRVFSKFFRGSNVIRMETEGTGLGLFITKNIIEAHGGTIWFESREGKGTTFWFTLPVKERYGEFLTEEFY